MINKKQGGSILVEVLIAAVIFAVALFALTSFQANLYRAHSTTGQQDVAIELAQSKMQEFRNYTALTTPTTSGFAYSEITSGASTSAAVAGAVYNMTWTVTDSTTSATDPAYKTVHITVSWTDSANNANSINADSIIARIDPKLTGQVSQTLP